MFVAKARLLEEKRRNPALVMHLSERFGPSERATAFVRSLPIGFAVRI
jgi:hypothetical protein